MNQDQVKKYWEDRAKSHPEGQKTTMDVSLREIEYRNLRKQILLNQPKTVLDVGCGDGKTTIRLAKDFPGIYFYGMDFSGSMILEAERSIGDFDNIEFKVGDILNPISDISFDLIFTNRCLINLTSWELQLLAIQNMKKLLNFKGILILIENIFESQEKFNCFRTAVGLHKIPIREHNLFFQRLVLIKELKLIFNEVGIKNISSTYYFITRIVYSRICKLLRRHPNYVGVTHKFSALLPSIGDMGPVNLISAKSSKKT
jgi:ubiquinone/menaquinone biosynthesis C-methylase UbiE